MTDLLAPPNVFLLLAGVSLLIAAHPYLSYPLSLLAARQMRRRSLAAEGPRPGRVDIVFCAYNEERAIAAKLDNVLELIERDPLLQARVYLDGPTDRTPEIIASKTHERLHVTVATQRGGKSRGMNRLLTESDADIVIFTDANVILDSAVAQAARAAFRDPAVGCLCGHLLYINADESPTAGLGALYWRIEEAIKQLETDTGSTPGADGSLFAIRRALFRPVPEDIIDDFYTSLNVLLAGKRVVRVEQMRATERSTTVRAEEFRRKVRIACRAFNCHRLLWPRIRSLPLGDLYKYLSHKFIRWITIYLLGLAAICLASYFFAVSTAHGLVASGIFAGGCLALWGGYRWRIPVLSAVSEIVAMYLATGLGVFHSLRGRRYTTWSIAPSSRSGD